MSISKLVNSSESRNSRSIFVSSNRRVYSPTVKKSCFVFSSANGAARPLSAPLMAAPTGPAMDKAPCNSAFAIGGAAVALFAQLRPDNGGRDDLSEAGGNRQRPFRFHRQGGRREADVDRP